ncbi:MAG: AraC family transcriptional regulator [Pedobacter sp.]|nr:AraC family transcriptional regulator [Pedobacter sp.]MDQ8051591.1 AraC family transcriptional regulator [Pedobacter sp.]
MLFSLPVIPLILFAICLITAITFYLVFRLNIPECFGRVMRFTLAYIFVNSCYTFFTEIYWPNDAWKDKIAPFLLMYGPILYFAILALKHNRLAWKTIFLHSIPFAIYLCYFIALHFRMVEVTQGSLYAYSKQLYILGPVSFLAYTAVSFIVGRNLFLNRFRDKLLMFVFGRTLLVFLSMLFLITFSTRMVNSAAAVALLRATIYGCMLLFVMIVFNYVVNKLLGRFPSANSRPMLPETVAKYERSPLSAEQLRFLGDQLAEAMDSEQLFLNTSLSLGDLAFYLKIPSHHLTQVLNVMFKQTFYQYVNGFRIDYACAMLLQDEEMNLEELAEKSGFNSKVSFHRQFKHIKGCTPAEFRLRNQTN